MSCASVYCLCLTGSLTHNDRDRQTETDSRTDRERDRQTDRQTGRQEAHTANNVGHFQPDAKRELKGEHSREPRQTTSARES